LELTPEAALSNPGWVVVGVPFINVIVNETDLLQWSVLSLREGG
jgi:hypothetical protein